MYRIYMGSLTAWEQEKERAKHALTSSTYAILSSSSSSSSAYIRIKSRLECAQTHLHRSQFQPPCRWEGDNLSHVPLTVCEQEKQRAKYALTLILALFFRLVSQPIH